VQPIVIQYIFKFKDRRENHVHLYLNPETLDLIADIPEELPRWAHLDFYECPNCLLTIQTHPHCPVAVHLVKLLGIFEHLQSHDIIQVQVITPERTVLRETSTQKGLSSLVGLIMATCGCPHTLFLRPSARFHLPFANASETAYRTISMYLLAQYFLRKQGGEADLQLEGLKKNYANIHVLNKSMANRLRAITDEDVALNAVVILDAFAQCVPFVIEESLDEIRNLFASYLKC
jgi:hypothetical protein